jgi:C4-dicarboxylate-specific signal transduction histidine kinase
MQGELAHVARVTTMGELAASIAHEVNQPLTAIATNTNACLRWLSADPPNLEEVRAGLTRILRDGKRADEVIRRIRGLLKKESPQAGPQDVNDLIREVLALLNDPLRSHHIGTTVELSTGVPAVLGDRVQLQQVVLNLVLNAIDAMSAVAGRARSLVVGSRREDSDGVEVTVSDSGAGVASADFDRLFDPFFTTKAEGMGMGLSVSRKIVESFGGRLWASANEGPGTTFHLTLRPVAPAPASGA